jgi:flagellar biosynthesis chaperone FliJ
MNILLENDLIDDDETIDLSKARKSLDEIENKLNSLLKD